MESIQSLHKLEQNYYSKDNFNVLLQTCKKNGSQISPESLLNFMQNNFKKYEQKLTKPGTISQKMKALNEKVVEDIDQIFSTNSFQSQNNYQTPNSTSLNNKNSSNLDPIKNENSMWINNHLGPPSMNELPAFFMPLPQQSSKRNSNNFLAKDKKTEDYFLQPDLLSNGNQQNTNQKNEILNKPFELENPNSLYQLSLEDDILERESISSNEMNEYDNPLLISGTHPNFSSTKTFSDKSKESENKRSLSPTTIHPKSFQMDSNDLENFLNQMNKEPISYSMDNETAIMNPAFLNKDNTNSLFVPDFSSAVSNEKTLEEQEKRMTPNNYGEQSLQSFPKNFEKRMNLQEPPKKITVLERLIHIDSKDRNLASYPNPSEFVVVFSPGANSKNPAEIFDSYGNLIAQSILEYVSNAINANVVYSYNNIQLLQCVGAVLPFHELFECGTSPYLYNNSQYDQNKVMSPNQFISYPYGPIFNDPDLGYFRNILEEPYLILNVPEFDSQGTNTHDGTNDVFRKAFAKLIYEGVIDTKGKIQRFIKFKPMELDYLKFYPTLLSNLDKMTLRLQKSDGELANFGIDKTFIRAIVPGNPLRPGAVPKTMVGKPSTRFYCMKYSSQYPNEYLTSHQLLPGDILYFYNIYPPLNSFSIMSPDVEISIIYTSLSSIPFSINFLGTPVANLPDPIWMIQFTLNKSLPGTPNPYYYPLMGSISVNDFLKFKYEQFGQVYTEISQVIQIQDTYFYINKLKNLDTTLPYKILEMGFSNPVLQGNLSNEKTSLFYKGGHCVNLFTTTPTIPSDPYSTNLYVDQNETQFPQSEIDPDSTLTIFEINYPYEWLESFIQNSYYPNQIFFINKKKQLSYTIRIQQQIIESGWGLSDFDQTVI